MMPHHFKVINVQKHQVGTHDQLDHGNWADGRGTTSLPKSVRQRLEDITGKRQAARSYGIGYDRGEMVEEVTYDQDLDRMVQNAVMTRDRLIRESEPEPLDVKQRMVDSAFGQQGFIDGATKVKRLYPRQSPTIMEYLTGFPSGKLASRYLTKHQAGTHDQLTHGNWADAIPRSAIDTQPLIDRLVKAGIIGTGSGRNAPKKVKQKIFLEDDEKAPEGSFVSLDWDTKKRYYEIDVLEEQGINNIERFRGGFGRLSEKYAIEGAIAAGADREKISARLDEISIRADKRQLQNFFYQEAMQMGLGRRLRDYYAQAMTERVAVLAQSRKQALLHELAKEYGGSEAYHEGGAKGVLSYATPEEIKESAETSRQNSKELSATQKALPDLLNRGKPTVAIHGDAMVKVLEDGRFKAQYETRESNGAYKPALRRTRELGMLGVPQDTKAKDRPIYGFITTQETGTTPNMQDYNDEMFNINSGGVGQYGGVRVTFKPEVAERTTYTMTDSLDGHAIGRPLRDNHTITSMSEAGLYDNVSLSSHGGKLREFYVEAQIHGGLGVKDIENIYVSDGWYENQTDRDADIAKIKTALADKKLEIPVKIIYDDRVEVAKRQITKSIAKATVLYRNSDGSEVLYTKTKDGVMMARVRDKYGRLYREQSVGTIIARGYWDVVYEMPDTELEKHQRGTHDQESHGDWADGDSVEVKGQGRPINVSGMRKQYEKNNYTLSSLSSDEKDNLDFYFLSGHRINEGIHRGWASKEYKNVIKTMDTLIESAPPLNGDFVYRMARANEFRSIRLGDVIESPSFLSTSTKNIYAPAQKDLRRSLQTLSSEPKVFLKITNNAGKSGLVLPAIYGGAADPTKKRESEVVLPRDTRLKVTKMDYVKIDGEDTNIYEMERIS